jgi:hypothetical protein
LHADTTSDPLGRAKNIPPQQLTGVWSEHSNHSRMCDGDAGNENSFAETVDFDAGQRRPTIHVDFVPGSRFAHPKAAGEHKVHDTQVKRLRHLNFFQHECYSRNSAQPHQFLGAAGWRPDWVAGLRGFEPRCVEFEPVSWPLPF